MMLVAKCSLCGHAQEFELTAEEAQLLKRYRIEGGSMGKLQDLFPLVPPWVRSCCIDDKSGGFGICPDCCAAR